MSPPTPGSSTLTISAPRSARYRDPNGPAPYCSTAMTRRPASGAGLGEASVIAARACRRGSPARDARVHGVRAHVVPVELDAEPGAGREPVSAVADPRRHVGELPEERVALLVEALHERVVRDAREEMRGHLGLLVVAELDTERGAQPGGLAPDRRPARPRRVEVRDVDRVVLQEVAQPAERRLALARGHRDRRLVPDVAHPAPVVRPAARLLEPADVVVGDPLPEL